MLLLGCTKILSHLYTEVKLETHSLDLSKMLTENKLMGCSNSLAEVAAPEYCIYGKAHISVYIPGVNDGSPGSRVGGIVDRLVLG